MSRAIQRCSEWVWQYTPNLKPHLQGSLAPEMLEDVFTRDLQREQMQNSFMKKYYAKAVCVLALACGLTATANTIPITNNGDGTDDPFNDIVGGGNINETLFGWLEGEILSWNNHVWPTLPPGTEPLPDPTTTLTIFEGAAALNPIQVQAGDYLVLHYGVGPDGEPSTGGGLVALYVTEADTFNAPPNGSGPNGTGGLSFVRLWDHGDNRIPDGGTTMLLLGGALAGFGLIRRKLS